MTKTDTQAADGLVNAVNGMGIVGRDPRASSRYLVGAPMTRDQLVSAWHQSGLIRKIVKIPADDMVREWRDWKAKPEEITALEAAERKLGLRRKIRSAEILRGRGGGLIVMGLPGDFNSPAPPKIGKGQLFFLNVLSRWQVNFAKRIDDSRSELYGEPEMWEANQTTGKLLIHPSRVIAFRGTDVGSAADGTGLSNAADAYWGESTVEQVCEAVMDSDTARQSFASLLTKASRLRVGIPDLFEILRTQGGEAQITARLAALSLGESQFNTTIYDAGNGGTNPGEELTDAVYSFAGARDMINAYNEFVSAVSDIPATRLFGRSPEGMNANGGSQQEDWHKMIRARQEIDLSSCLDRIDEYLIQSALGTTRETNGVWYEWAPLDAPTQKDDADRFNIVTQAISKLQLTGAIPEAALAEAVQGAMIEGGYLPGLEAALAKIPEDERFGLAHNEPEPQLGPFDPATLSPDDPRLQAANDARPRTLYVSRKLLNAADLIAWAKEQGLSTTLAADDMHVTVAYSRQAIDWFSVQGWTEDEIIIKGGPRMVERFSEGALVLLFGSTELGWRHRQMIEAGATWDHAEYQPHVTITYNAADADISAIKPYVGELRFGPEIWAEVDNDWKAKATEV